jgi:ABC-type multidrug transport system ATPase subunit
VRSSPPRMSCCPVLAAGVGLRHHHGWALRSVSFRLDGPPGGPAVTGIVTSDQAAGAAFVAMLAGAIRPTHGELRVLGEDLTTPGGRAVVRQLVGAARRPGAHRPRARVRRLAERGARRSGLPRRDTEALAAAILDRLGLTAWADVPVRAAPTVIVRRALLAAAAVHEPDLLLLDGLVDDLGPRELASLADGMRELAKDTAVLVAGSDEVALGLACDQVLTLSGGILAGA